MRFSNEIKISWNVCCSLFLLYGNVWVCVCVCVRAGVSMGVYAVTFDTLSKQFRCYVHSIFKQKQLIRMGNECDFSQSHWASITVD